MSPLAINFLICKRGRLGRLEFYASFNFYHFMRLYSRDLKLNLNPSYIATGEICMNRISVTCPQEIVFQILVLLNRLSKDGKNYYLNPMSQTCGILIVGLCHLYNSRSTWSNKKICVTLFEKYLN